jgi:deazaflavin-dependent oxidoreductase (nitroreductase family)
MSFIDQVPWIKEHIELYKKDPEKAHMWDSSAGGGKGLLATLLLTMKGRKSGKELSLPLIYGEVDGNYIVVASKGGMPNHPLWYLNLQANPDCKLMVGPKPVTARARTANDEERARIWPIMADLYPPYNAYQKSAGDRVIPVVILEPQG